MKNLNNLLTALNFRSPVWAQNPILAGYRGSHAHGTFIPPEDPRGTDDIDVFGVAVRNPDYYLGLDGYHPEKRGTFATPGETLDIETHEIRKFCYLLVKGNPNVHQHLWLRPEHYFIITRAGRMLLDNRKAFMSKALFRSFAGYAHAQFSRMEKFEKRGYMGAKREAIVKELGYDCKNAAHCLRLLYGAIYLAQHDELQVFLKEPAKSIVMGVKRGSWSLEEVKRHAQSLHDRLEKVKTQSKLPDQVDRDVINSILRGIIGESWYKNYESI